VERTRAQLLLRVGVVAYAVALTITCGVGAFGFLTGDRTLGAYMVVAAILLVLAFRAPSSFTGRRNTRNRRLD
jgi:hypothetical protein